MRDTIKACAATSNVFWDKLAGDVLLYHIVEWPAVPAELMIMMMVMPCDIGVNGWRFWGVFTTYTGILTPGESTYTFPLCGGRCD